MCGNRGGEHQAGAREQVAGAVEGSRRSTFARHRGIDSRRVDSLADALSRAQQLTPRAA